MLLNETLLESVVKILREELETIVLPEKSIRITNEDRVPPYAGEEFINIYGAQCSNEAKLEAGYRKEVYSFKVGITRRFVGIPIDVSAESIYTYDEELISRTKASMSMRAYEIIRQIDGNWGIPALIRQNSALQSYDFCILTTVGYIGNAELEEVGAEHFSTEEETNDAVGLFLELSFGGMQAYFNKY